MGSAAPAAKALLLAVLVLSGCGGGVDPAASPAGPSAATPAAPPESAPPPASAPAPSPSSTGPRVLQPVEPSPGRRTTPLRFEVVGPAPEGLRVRVELPTPCHSVLGADVAETAEAVRVQVVGALPPPDQICTQVLEYATYVVPLQSPLGDRRVEGARR